MTKCDESGVTWSVVVVLLAARLALLLPAWFLLMRSARLVVLVSARWLYVSRRSFTLVLLDRSDTGPGTDKNVVKMSVLPAGRVDILVFRFSEVKQETFAQDKMARIAIDQNRENNYTYIFLIWKNWSMTKELRQKHHPALH